MHVGVCVVKLVGWIDFCVAGVLVVRTLWNGMSFGGPLYWFP